MVPVRQLRGALQTKPSTTAPYKAMDVFEGIQSKRTLIYGESMQLYRDAHQDQHTCRDARFNLCNDAQCWSACVCELLSEYSRLTLAVFTAVLLAQELLCAAHVPLPIRRLLCCALRAAHARLP
eukprot:IDg6940t1